MNLERKAGRKIYWVQSLYYDKDRNISGKLENLAK